MGKHESKKVDKKIQDTVASSLEVTEAAIQIFLKTHWSELMRESPPGAKLPFYKKMAEIIYALYLNAYHSDFDFFILGGNELRLCDPQMTLEKKEEIQKLLINLGTCASAYDKKGAILFESNWFITLNDYWMLGALHAGKEFHFYTRHGAVPKIDLLWDNVQKRPRVLGREILILYEAGYRLVKHEHRKTTGLFFTCIDREKAQAMTIQECRKVVDEVKASQKITEILDSFVDTKAFFTTSLVLTTSQPSTTHSPETPDPAC